MSDYSDDPRTMRYPPGTSGQLRDGYALRAIGFECMGVPLFGWATPEQAEKAGRGLRELVKRELASLGFDTDGNPTNPTP